MGRQATDLHGSSIPDPMAARAQPLIDDLLRAIAQRLADVDAALNQLQYLMPFAESPPESDGCALWVAAVNARLFRETRNTLSGRDFEGAFQLIDQLRRQLVEVLGVHHHETGLRLSAELERWNGDGLDLIRPPHIGENDVVVPTDAVASAWRISAEYLQSQLREALTIVTRSPHGDDPWVTYIQLAKSIGVNAEALRKRLERAHAKRLFEFRENAERGPRTCKHEYRLSFALPIAQRLKAKRPANRPPEK